MPFNLYYFLFFQTPTQAPTAKTQPQKKKVTEKLPRTIYKKTVAPSPKLDTQSPISNGTTNNVQIKEPKTPVSIVATPVPNSETTSPVTPSSGQRSQRIRVPPKWCENMIMEYEVTVRLHILITLLVSFY